MSPVFSQEFGPDTQSQPSVLLPFSGSTESPEAGRRVRASFTALGLALSLGATGSLVSSAEAADSMQLAALPSVTGGANTLPSFGSSRPDNSSASYHTVVDGETIWDIARQHGLSVDVIKSANGMGEGQVIQVGQVLKVPTVATGATALADVSGVDIAKADETIAVASEPESEPAIAALPAATAPQELQTFTLEELRLDRPQAAPDFRQEVVLESAPGQATGTDSVNGDLAVQSGTGNEVAALPTAAPDSVLDGLETPSVVAGVQTEFSSIEQFSEQLNVIRETAETSGSREASDALSTVDSETLTHRVRAGETVWSIARTYGLDPDDLQQLNAIADPRSLMPGDKIAVPTDLPLTEVEAELLGRRQSANKRQLAAIETLGRTSPEPANVDAVTTVDEPSSAALIASAEPESLEIEPSEVVTDDPFVANLLAEIAEVNGARQAAAPAAVEATPAARDTSPLSAEENGDEAIANLPAETVAINPEFTGDVSETDLTDFEERLSSEDLLAAAPLGSEVYAPVLENPAGRIVTPEMPVMPGQDVYLPEAPNRFDGYMWPAQGVLTSGYGWRWGRMHRGVDIAGPVGTPIYAAGSGVVERSGWNSGGYGNLVDIRHPDGSLTRYAHNSRLLVSPGQQVRQGQQIAEMGSTGYSTGPHLHFEIHIPNQGTVNPMAMLPNR
ncbi:MAG: peptidoglycan DD-metalloendopeptidase family protein [Cyanobacteria bacterium P01_C01_bin.120]